MAEGRSRGSVRVCAAVRIRPGRDELGRVPAAGRGTPAAVRRGRPAGRRRPSRGRRGRGLRTLPGRGEGPGSRGDEPFRRIRRGRGRGLGAPERDLPARGLPDEPEEPPGLGPGRRRGPDQDRGPARFRGGEHPRGGETDRRGADHARGADGPRSRRSARPRSLARIRPRRAGGVRRLGERAGNCGRRRRCPGRGRGPRDRAGRTTAASRPLGRCRILGLGHVAIGPRRPESHGLEGHVRGPRPAGRRVFPLAHLLLAGFRPRGRPGACGAGGPGAAPGEAEDRGRPPRRARERGEGACGNQDPRAGNRAPSDGGARSAGRLSRRGEPVSGRIGHGSRGPRRVFRFDRLRRAPFRSDLALSHRAGARRPLGQAVKARLIAAVLLVALACRGGGEPKEKEAPAPGSTGTPSAPTPVRVAAVAHATLPLTVSAPGRTAALAQQKLRAPFAGTLTELKVADGDPVSRGQNLGTIVARESEAALSGAREMLRQAATPAEKSDAERALALAEKNLVRRALVASWDGAVIAHTASAGDRVTEDQEILTISDAASLIFLADVPQSDLLRILPGQKATVELAGGRPPVAGAVHAVLPGANPADFTGQVRVDLSGAAGRGPIGLFGTARILVGERTGAAVVPDAAVLRDDVSGVARVCLASNGKAHWIDVVPGVKDSGRTEIVSPPLSDGQAVIVSGRVAVREGKIIAIEP